MLCRFVSISLSELFNPNSISSFGYIYYRLIKHSSHGFMNENVTDKLRIQIFQIASNNQFSLIGKKDVPLYSIVSREIHSSFMSKQNQESNLNESIGDLNQYSSFSHGNSLNAMMGLAGTSGNLTHRNRMIDKNIRECIFFLIFLNLN